MVLKSTFKKMFQCKAITPDILVLLCCIHVEVGANRRNINLEHKPTPNLSLNFVAYLSTYARVYAVISIFALRSLYILCQ